MIREATRGEEDETIHQTPKREGKAHKKKQTRNLRESEISNLQDLDLKPKIQEWKEAKNIPEIDPNIVREAENSKIKQFQNLMNELGHLLCVVVYDTLAQYERATCIFY